MKQTADLLPLRHALPAQQAASPAIRCMIVDDEPHALQLLRQYIIQTGGLELLGTSFFPAEILARAGAEMPDLLFVDVEMPQLNGLDLVRLLQGKCLFILCSGHRQYALEGFEHDVCDYLLKPVTYSRFIKAVEKAKQQLLLNRLAGTPPGEKSKRFVVLKGGRKHRRLKIYFDEIDYIRCAGHYLCISVKGEKNTVHLNMKEMLNLLPASEFIRVHKTYIIPLNRISYVDFEELGLRGVEQPIPVGDTYRKELMRTLKDGM